ncbi:MAG: hypothetical protein ACKVZJ_13315 [Phycisphaerales bacterium]
MVELTRTVRFSVNDGAASLGEPAHNSFAAAPPMSGLGPHCELDVRCRGEVDPATGYCINIKDIDRAVRSAAIPAIAAACVRGLPTGRTSASSGLKGKSRPSTRATVVRSRNLELARA